MHRRLTIKLPLLALTALVASACATVKPLGEWRSEAYDGRLGKILVIGVTSRSTRRRVYEDKLVEALAAAGISGVPSYQLITSSVKLSRATVEDAVRARGLDGVLVTRLVGVRDKEVYVDPSGEDYNRSYLSYYDHAWHEVESGYAAQYRVLTLETNLYDAASGELVWSMQSQTMDSSQPRHVIEDQIRLAVDALKRRGLLATAP